MENERPAHSPLGASSAERWMNCPGSVALIKELAIPETTDEPDYRANGTAAHEALAKCLTEGLDAWEVVGQVMSNGVKVDVEIADGIQVFIDTVRPSFEHAEHVLIEQSISASIHPDFYGTVDCGVVCRATLKDRYGDVVEEFIDLDVSDYKHGEGVAVDVEWNPQVLYYAYGILVQHPEINGKVTMRIIQPRIPYLDAVREFVLDADIVRQWAEGTLAPAMVRTSMDHSLDAGPHCRFCPAKLVCPLLTSLFKAAATHNPKEVVTLEDASLGMSYQSVPAVKHYLKALEDETFRRLNLGAEVPGTKLVHKKANRVWKPGAAALFIERIGEEALTKPELKSPTAIEDLGPAMKTLVKEWAYTPESGLTVALESDRRVGVKVQTTKELFSGAVAALNQGE